MAGRGPRAQSGPRLPSQEWRLAGFTAYSDTTLCPEAKTVPHSRLRIIAGVGVDGPIRAGAAPDGAPAVTATPSPLSSSPPAPVDTPTTPTRRFLAWLLEQEDREPAGSSQRPSEHKQHAWWQVMCLTGVDYFSTLGYRPGIAALAAGALSPLATLPLVLLTLFGALPMYRRVAQESPHGEGSIAMLERLLPWWEGKLFVLCLLGFAATDFIITITLSAADATAHVLENPMVPQALTPHRVEVTLAIVALLGLIFLKGFGEAIVVAVGLVATFLALNVGVVAVGMLHILEHPDVVPAWERALVMEFGSPWTMLAVSLLLFPKLALGLSGFETGVAVMPLVRGDPDDSPDLPAGRIRNARRLLLTAAGIMSVLLLASSFVTIVLIPAEEFLPGGKANGRALAYLAHAHLGDGFGTAYDLSTILILWFAGASAMAGLLNIVPRFLPRYGMAPEWAAAKRPLVLVFTAIAFAVTIVFRADVDAQGGAYATGVLVLMSSAALAVTLAVWHSGRRHAAVAFGLIALVFGYTTVANVVERPEGVKIASLFIAAIVVTSLASRIARSTELRVHGVELRRDGWALHPGGQSGHYPPDRARPDQRTAAEYRRKEEEQRASDCIPAGEPVLFLEVTVGDSSEFARCS